MKGKITSAKLLKGFVNGPKPGETEEQRKEKALAVFAAMMNEGRVTMARTISVPRSLPSRVGHLVCSTVNAPYGTHYDANDLAALINEPGVATRNDPAVFAFFSEVDVKLQVAFLKEYGIGLDHAKSVVHALSALAGYNLPLTQTWPDLLDAEGQPTI
ncbi:hypothetical protein [Rhizobium sp. MHM7A]|uniref:hypothetical protein n=1 Tax=Rhizobium sp. MHM7A TaxID=2583233 RepID=UPI00197FB90F|nr:hypothetical protein [Rhizobium sp. MHM7A]